MFCNSGQCACLSTYIAAASYCYQKIDPGQAGCLHHEQCFSVWPDAYCDTSSGVGTCRCGENKIEKATRDGHVCLDVYDSNQNTLAITCPLPEGAGYTSALSDPKHPKQNNRSGPVLCNSDSIQTTQSPEELGDGAVACVVPSDGSYIADLYDCVEFVSTMDLTSQGYSEKANGICCPNRAFTCIQPTATGPNPTEPRWWYNAITGVCQQFLWDPTAVGPGEHSPNNFRTVEHCESYCRDSCIRGASEYEQRSSLLEQTPITGCSQAVSCGNHFECKTVGSSQWCCPSVATVCGIVGGRPLDPSIHTRETVYHSGVEKQGTSPSTRFFYDPNSGKCSPFTYYGAGGNYNNFLSRIDCELFCARLQCDRGNPLRIGDVTQGCQSNDDCPSSHECKVDQSVCCPRMQTICTQPLLMGNCDRSVRRFYYSASTRECQSFEYTGCQGNDNNFETLVDCQTFCRNAAPEPRCSQGQAYKDASGKFVLCSINRQSSSCPANYECHFDGTMHGCCPTKAYTCSLSFHSGKTCGPGISFKYYYNTQTQECESFEYFGCDGNSNNFNSRTDCENYCGVGGCANGGIPLRDSSGSLQTCSEKEGGCPSSHECQAVALGIDITSYRCCPTKRDICSLPSQAGSSLCSGGSSVVSRYYFNIVTRKCTSFVYNGCDGNPNNFASLNQCNNFCLASACKAGDVVYLNPNTQQPISCKDELQNNCPKNFQCIYDQLTDQSVCCGATDMGVCPDGEKAYINAMDTTVRECLINEHNSCPRDYLCRFNTLKNRYFCCGSLKKNYCPSGRASFKDQVSLQPLRCTMNKLTSGCPDGFECQSDLKDALQGYCCSVSDICPNKEEYFVDESSGMPRSCTIGHFVTCPQGFTCMTHNDGAVGYCCKGPPVIAPTDGCPPGEIVFMERNEVVICDPFNSMNQGCPESFSCQWSVRSQRYQCCGVEVAPVQIESDGCPSRQIAFIDLDTKKPKICTSATHLCPTGYFCQFSNDNKQFQCCGIPSQCPTGMVAFISMTSEPQGCSMQGGQPCPEGFSCVKGKSGNEICCAGGEACDSSQVRVNGECLSRQPIGSPCLDSMQCVGGSYCQKGKCRCPSKMKEEAQQCVPIEELQGCSERQILVNDECLPLVSLGRACVHNLQCPRNAICIEGVCDCPRDYKRKGDDCDKLIRNTKPVISLMPKPQMEVTHKPLVLMPTTSAPKTTTSAPVENSLFEGLCSTGTPYMNNGIARKCLAGQTCPYGYRCSFSKTVQEYFCCTTGSQDLRSTIMKEACAVGEAMIFPKTGQPVVCSRFQRCPEGYGCRRNTRTRQFHCCSQTRTQLDMETYMLELRKQGGEVPPGVYLSPLRPNMKKKKPAKTNFSAPCPGHLVLFTEEVKGKIIRRCQLKCPVGMSPVAGIFQSACPDYEMFGCITPQPRRRGSPRLDDGDTHLSRSYSERGVVRNINKAVAAGLSRRRTSSLRDRSSPLPPPLPVHRHQAAPEELKSILISGRKSSYPCSELKAVPLPVAGRVQIEHPEAKMKKLDKWMGHLLSEGNSRNAVQDHRSNGWQYADEVQIRVAPLATVEEEVRSRPPPRPSKAGVVLQSLREQDNPRRNIPPSTLNVPNSSYGGGRISPNNISPSYSSSIVTDCSYLTRDYRDVDASLSPNTFRPITNDNSSFRSQLDEMNVVFLQYNDEVKRSILPPHIGGLSQIKIAFLRAFPNLARSYIEQPNVKVYIQDQSKAGAQIFYELEDPKDIRNKSVLKLKEKHYNGLHTGLQSPVRFLEQPDYLSETEYDSGRPRVPTAVGRPASALAHADFGPPKPIRQKSYDPYMDNYASDSSSVMDSRASVTRSGSTTPVIDRESRVRMETMERQLAGLSSLVHSALVSKGMSETAHKDMAELRKEILALHPEIRESSEEPSSIPESLTSHTHHQLGALKHKIQQANTEIHQLRRTAQINAQAARTLIKDAGEQITHLIQERMGGGSFSVSSRQSESEIEEREREQHAERLADLLKQLTDFEQNVELVRSSVLQTNKKLRMSEVEQMTENLTEIGRTAAALKTEFPPIQQSIERKLKSDMERIVREEKFIKEQTAAVDQTLRRCKGLANIMVTMKKLAMVQDPSLRSKKDKEAIAAPAPSLVPSTTVVTNAVNTIQTTTPPVTQPSFSGPPDISNERPATFTPTVDVKNPPNIVEACPPVPPAPKYYQSPASSLDGVLDEVGQPGQPPRPPSRFSVTDVRNKFTKAPEIPDQLKNLIQEVARRPSPAPDRDVIAERRHDLEERQERLAEKQKQLKNQFQQLQQLTPLP
ncbi:unnamed protein product [Auanema sp. JU1783]|nr:unnamed protein product [Auanema sp. JU1783]